MGGSASGKFVKQKVVVIGAGSFGTAMAYASAQVSRLDRPRRHAVRRTRFFPRSPPFFIYDYRSSSRPIFFIDAMMTKIKLMHAHDDNMIYSGGERNGNLHEGFHAMRCHQFGA
jgi:hypothetical protein